MPYLNQETKNALTYRLPQTAGELNYKLTELCKAYLYQGRGESYQWYNDIIGALEACKLEFYRRATAPYEDTKIQSNGDVF